MSNAIARRDPREEKLRDLLGRAAPRMQEVMPQHLTAERLVRLTNLCVSKTPKLLNCTPISVLTSVMVAARLGLDPDGALGSAYLVPYGKECQLIIGYRGLIDLARRSGKVAKIEARLVYANDHFVLRYGTDETLDHVPTFNGDRGDWYCGWAMATLHDGTRQIEVMTRDQINEIAKSSQVWREHPEEMARKTVVRRLAKYLPLSPEMAAASVLQVGDEQGSSSVHAAAQSLEIELVDEQPEDESAVASITEDLAGPAEEADDGEAQPE